MKGVPVSVRWTCHHKGNRDYCHREHKSKEAAEQCAFRLERSAPGDDPNEWETIQVEKGFYSNGGEVRSAAAS